MKVATLNPTVIKRADEFPHEANFLCNITTNATTIATTNETTMVMLLVLIVWNEAIRVINDK